MAQMVRRQVVAVMVDFHGFGIQDADDTRVPVPFPEGFEFGEFLSASAGRLDFGSAGHTHTASLTVEVWDAEPVVPEGEWEKSGEACMICSAGELRVWAVAGGPMPELIRLSDGPGRWRVRVVCAGRAEVAVLARETVPHGVERYVAQFWPGA